MTAISQAQKESTGQVQPRRQRRELSDRAILNLFIWPTLILLIAWNLFPLIYSLFLSFTDYSAIANKAPTWVGFQNYADILSDPQMWKYFATTGRYALVTVGMQTILGFSLAVLVQEKFKGSGLVTTLILVPMMLSPVVVGMFWKLMYNPSFGYFNFLLGFRNPSTAPEMLAGRFAGQPVPN
ncbi:MAG: sugar ABC transporter permease, partial [Anaerolineae bacterium]|nr:sugar ABC transporter permease [Anaerolineae bacterium]